jgi:hypothetical protein
MKFRFLVNGVTLKSPKQIVIGKEVLEAASLLPVENYELLKKTNHKGFEPIQLTEEVDLTDPGIESFSAELNKSLSIFINDKEFKIDECYSSPNELLKLAGFNNLNYYLTQTKKGNVEIGYKEENDADHKVFIKDGAKFSVYPREQRCVIVNASNHIWNKKTISFEEVIRLAFGSACNPNFTYTVTYTRGIPEKPRGSLVKGTKVVVKSKMIFDVQQTNKS